MKARKKKTKTQPFSSDVDALGVEGILDTPLMDGSNQPSLFSSFNPPILSILLVLTEFCFIAIFQSQYTSERYMIPLLEKTFGPQIDIQIFPVFALLTLFFAFLSTFYLEIVYEKSPKVSSSRETLMQSFPTFLICCMIPLNFPSHFQHYQDFHISIILILLTSRLLVFPLASTQVKNKSLKNAAWGIGELTAVLVLFFLVFPPLLEQYVEELLPIFPTLSWPHLSFLVPFYIFKLFFWE